MLTYNFKELDATLGEDLYYYGARYYDAAIGRFGSPDPIRSYLNPYSYANNNPIRYVDVAGMASALVSGQASPKDVSGFSTFLDPLAKEKMISSPRERVMTEEEANLIRRIFGGNESESESEKPLNEEQVEEVETEIRASAEDVDRSKIEEFAEEAKPVLEELAGITGGIEIGSGLVGKDNKLLGRYALVLSGSSIALDDVNIILNPELSDFGKGFGVIFHSGMWAFQEYVEAKVWAKTGVCLAYDQPMAAGGFALIGLGLIGLSAQGDQARIEWIMNGYKP